MTLNDPDVEAVFTGGCVLCVWLCAIKIVETFKHHSYIIHKATVDKSEIVLCVWGEQCHQIDDNKLGANSCRKTLVG